MKTLLFLLGAIAVIFFFPFKQFETITLYPTPLEIYVKGEVIVPQYYEVSPYSTLKDLLKIIKLTDEADISTLDLNRALIDNEIISIPAKAKIECISINAANLKELITLPGIGEVSAQRIIDYRNTIGVFLETADLMDVKGIGPSKYEKLKSYICP